MTLHQFPDVTRVEVIDATGRVFVGYFDIAGAEIHQQDEGRTIKIFTEGVKVPPVKGTHYP